MSGSRWFGLLVLAIALVGFGYWLRAPPSPVTVAAALASGEVQMDAAVAGADGSAVSLTLRRPQGGTGAMRVRLEAGTVLYVAGYQRLIVAAPVEFSLSEQQPSVRLTVETFCIDEFLANPPEGVAVSLSPPGGGSHSVTEETEPLHKLVNCLAGEDLPQSDKQLAVWAVAEGLMEKSRDDAIDHVSRGLAERMMVERRAQLERRKPALMEMARNLDEARIDQLIEAELNEGASELRQVADMKAREQVQNFIDHDKNAMGKCGYAVATLQIFQ